jgi:hypothetical protein
MYVAKIQFLRLNKYANNVYNSHKSSYNIIKYINIWQKVPYIE